jgi:hypothetical protein
VGPRGVVPPKRRFEDTLVCGEQATAIAAAFRQHCNVASLWAVDLRRRLKPLNTRPKHTQHFATLEFASSSWRVCLGLEIRMLRFMPKAEHLTAPGLFSVVWVSGA